jgi:hypothetical protein
MYNKMPTRLMITKKIQSIKGKIESMNLLGPSKGIKEMILNT